MVESHLGGYRALNLDNGEMYCGQQAAELDPSNFTFTSRWPCMVVMIVRAGRSDLMRRLAAQRDMALTSLRAASKILYRLLTIHRLWHEHGASCMAFLVAKGHNECAIRWRLAYLERT